MLWFLKRALVPACGEYSYCETELEYNRMFCCYNNLLALNDSRHAIPCEYFSLEESSPEYFTFN